MSALLTALQDRADKLASDAKVHEDAIAAINAERRGIQFAIELAHKIPASPLPVVDAPREEAPTRRPRRTKAQIEADHRASQTAAPQPPAITPGIEPPAKSDMPPVPAFLKRTEAPPAQPQE